MGLVHDVYQRLMMGLIVRFYFHRLSFWVLIARPLLLQIEICNIVYWIISIYELISVSCEIILCLEKAYLKRRLAFARLEIWIHMEKSFSWMRLWNWRVSLFKIFLVYGFIFILRLLVFNIFWFFSLIIIFFLVFFIVFTGLLKYRIGTNIMNLLFSIWE